MTDRSQSSSWAADSAVIFAATMMVLVGVFQALEGLAAILNDQFFVVAPNYTYAVDVTAWGWIHLILGVLILLGGIFLFKGSSGAAIFAITLAILSAVANFLFIPYQPFWSLLIIGINIWVIWGLSRAMADSA